MAYCTVAQVRAYTGITATNDDSLIEALITRASRAIDIHTHRTFETASDSTRYFDAERDTRDDYLLLDWSPYGLDLCQITNVVNGDGVTIAAASYATEPRHYTPYYGLRLKLNSGYYWTYDDDPENAIAVTGRWAYSITPPNDIVHASIRMATYLYRQKDSNVFDVLAIPGSGVIEIPQGIPKDVAVMLEPYRRIV